jgi:hypothetical protein
MQSIDKMNSLATLKKDMNEADFKADAVIQQL